VSRISHTKPSDAPISNGKSIAKKANAWGARLTSRAKAQIAAAAVAVGACLSAVALAVLAPPFGLAHALAIAGSLVAVLGAAAVIWNTNDGKKLGSAEPGAPSFDSLEQIKDAHWQLEDRVQHYRQLLDAQEDFVVRRTEEGRLVFANAAFCKAFGVDPETILGTTFTPKVLMTDPGLPGQSRHRVVELIRTANGKRWIAWDRTSIQNADGHIEIQNVGRDVTEERDAEIALREARDQAEAASRAKSRFLATMSHEIRTPMNGVLGMTDLLRETIVTGEQNTYLGAIEKSARSLLALIDEILDFSKIEAGKLELTTGAFSLRGCLSGALELLAPRAAVKGLDMACTLAPEIPQFVRGDELRVRQIVLNLISNAVKFTDRGGVTVRVDIVDGGAYGLRGSRIAIEVRDTGIGFSEDMIKHLFEEFEQADPAVTRQEGGTGLGLAISRRLARAMGGDIFATGKPGEGATFTAILRLPPVSAPADGVTLFPADTQASAPRRTDDDMHAAATAASGLHVLIAEDNEINALLARRLIERAGGQATVVRDGRAAIAAVKRTIEKKSAPVDIILMDVFMPVVGGLEATITIKELYRTAAPGLRAPPIIALTANAFPEDRSRCLAAGMDDYLSKPFDAVQLRELLLKWRAKKCAGNTAESVLQSRACI
jgi:PAS domain S-box-containing protein